MVKPRHLVHYMLMVFFMIMPNTVLADIGQSSFVTLEVLNEPSETGALVLAQGDLIEVRFEVVDDPSFSNSRNDRIQLINLETSKVVGSRKRGRDLEGNVSFRTGPKTVSKTLAVRYVQNNTVIETASATFLVVSDAQIVDILNRLVAVEETGTGSPGPVGPQGDIGPQGLIGATGADGSNGLSCWDLNGDDIADVEEDINKDGYWDTLDCQGMQSTQTLSRQVVFIKDVKNFSYLAVSAGGTCYAAWQTRDLNEMTGDLSFATLNINSFTLIPGEYLFEAKVPGNLVHIHQAKLVVQGGGNVLVGSSERSHPTYGSN